MTPRARRLVALVSILLTGVLVATAAAAPLSYDLGAAAPPAPRHDGLVVGYSSPSVLHALAALGASTAKSSVKGYAVVNVEDEASFMRAAPLVSGVTFVDYNRYVRSDGSSWDGSAWDGSAWDGSAWDGSSWDGSSWDGSAWDGSAWDGSAWDGSTWDGSAWDGSTWDGSAWDGSAWDGSTWDGSSWDGSSDGYTRADPALPLQWGLGTINGPGAWDTTVGTKNRVICSLDSGVDYRHPDLAGNMWTATDGTFGWDFVNGDNDPMDDAGHGTHTAGIAAAVSGNGVGITGVAQAKIMAVKVLGANGEGTEADLALGIDWCVERGAHILLMSMGTPIDARVVKEAVARAETRGALLIATMGNSGCECKRYPAAYATVLAVGAVDSNGTRTDFSNTGGHIDLMAPGLHIASLYTGGQYRAGSGTSQAAPFVAGAAALAWGLHTDWNGKTMREVLKGTATPIPGDAKLVGDGIVDARAAVDYARTH